MFHPNETCRLRAAKIRINDLAEDTIPADLTDYSSQPISLFSEMGMYYLSEDRPGLVDVFVGLIDAGVGESAHPLWHSYPFLGDLLDERERLINKLRDYVLPQQDL